MGKLFRLNGYSARLVGQALPDSPFSHLDVRRSLTYEAPPGSPASHLAVRYSLTYPFSALRHFPLINFADYADFEEATVRCARRG